MRAFCTVSAPLEGCAPPTTPLLPGSRFLALKLLGSSQPLYFLVEAKSRVREVYAQTCLHFAKQGMLDTELFGLAVLSDDEYLFADPESKLSKYGPKSWRSSHTHGLDANGRPLLELHFRVQFYVESPLMLRDEVSRHYYYLQLKANAVSRDQPKECYDQSMLLLGGLALQADLGDIATNTTGSNNFRANAPSSTSSLALSLVDDEPSSASVPPPASQLPSSSSQPAGPAIPTRLPAEDYFRVEDYIPAYMRSTWGSTAIQSCHREYRGMSTADAETRYIREACSLGDCINAHVFRMKQSKSDASPGHARVIVYSKGIKVVMTESGDQETMFLWPSITKLSFERKKFEIRSGLDRITLYSACDDKNKMLLSLCRDTHQFSMKIAPRLTEAIRREQEEDVEETSSIHTQYMYSRSMHLPMYPKSKNEQRVSVISSTSSNTTSGIISDRVQSEDELEIMINSPPVAPISAPSTESLALAHLLDQGGRPSVSVSRQTSLSSGDVLEHHQEGSAEDKTSASPPGKEGDSSSSSPNKSMHNMGSQSSSTCSTVVIATSSASVEAPTSLTVSPACDRRQLSTSSSLELGYSHTAQNSSLSEVPSSTGHHHSNSDGNNDQGGAMDGNEDEDEEGHGDMSGVYTLAHAAPPTETSGVYTMNSSEMTGRSSEIAESVSDSHDSSHYGCFQPMLDHQAAVDGSTSGNRDSVDGKFIMNPEDVFRLRSNSIISTAGSFRGDGSDPTDKKHVLLSAEELTDLIVGRGTYPNRKTVSDNMDCDCDYVTLPLSLKGGDSYIQGHQDTAPTEDAFDEDGAALLTSADQQSPPAPPKRIDSVSTMRGGHAEGQQQQQQMSLPPPPPPPYNARHETTGLCGPPVKLSLPVNMLVKDVPEPVVKAKPQPPLIQLPAAPLPVLEDAPVLPLRDPPPYPQQPQSIRYTATVPGTSLKHQQLPLQSSVVVTPVPVPQMATAMPTPPPSTHSAQSTASPEEATARFIKTRPNINILKAHTSVVGEKPSFAAPTYATQHHPPLPQSSQQGGLQAIPSTIGIPLMPYTVHTAHKSMSALHPTTYLDTKSAPRTCVLLPVIKPRQFLPPPPPKLPRQPPPPPPTQSVSAAQQLAAATVYSSSLARSQIELFQQQLYSDVDYVIYPIQDPAVSQQEYLDAKQGSILAAMAAQGAHHPPPYLAAAYHHQYPAAGKTHALYRSTPFLPIQMPMSARYASTQNLSDTYIQLPGTYSPMYSPSMASLCSSYCEPPPPPLPPIRPNAFHRSRSDDNILKSIETMPRSKRLPPPPPRDGRSHSMMAMHEPKRINKPPIPTPVEEEQQQQHVPSQQRHLNPPPVPAKTFYVNGGKSSHQNSPGNSVHGGTGTVNSPMNAGTVQGQQPQTPQQSVDIQLIRERSKNLDLPLIAALCNDRSLLKQTKAFGMPKPGSGVTGAMTVNGQGQVSAAMPTTTTNSATSGQQQNLKGSVNNLNASRNKYPVSGLGTLQLAKPKKATVSHRHPQDKLPPLPGQTNGEGVIKTTEGNNYVMDPIKHKGYNSQS